MNMTNTPRKTAKYYREILSGNNIYAAIKVLPEIIKKFGYKRWESSKGNDILRVRKYTEFEWNHRIEGFFITDKGKVCVDIYWQGDSTDGSKSLYVDECINGNVIRAEHEWLGDHTYCRHSDIRISREEFANAIKAVAKYLSPEEIKVRKEADRKANLQKQVYDLIAEDAPKDKRGGWGRDEGWEYYWNGRYAVQKVLEANPSLLDKTFEELKPIVLLVYKNNHKSDYSLRGGWYSGEKKYNLAY